MTNEPTKTLDYYKGLPYGIALRKDEDGDWVARIEELSGCLAHGSTPAEALENLEEVRDAWLDDAIEAGDAIPEPDLACKVPSGKWLQRVPRSLHKSLTEMAENEGVSLNQFVTSVLSEAVGARRAAPGRLLKTCVATESWPDLGKIWCEGISEWNEWQIEQSKPVTLKLFDVLQGKVAALPNKISENDFKVSELASKKENAFTA